MRFARRYCGGAGQLGWRFDPALAAAPQHHDQVPGFFRLKVGDLEVTALFDGPGVFDPHWLNGKKATMDRVAQALHRDPHRLDVADFRFPGQHRQAINPHRCRAGHLVGWGSTRALGGQLRSAGYTPEEVDLVWSHISTPITSAASPLRTESASFQMPRSMSRSLKATFAVARNRCQGAEGCATVLPECTSDRSAVHQGGKWHTFSGSEPVVDGRAAGAAAWSYPGNTGYEFSSKGQKILFWGDIIHAQRVQLQHPEVTAVFDIDQATAAATRNHCCLRLVREDIVIAGRTCFPPWVGCARRGAAIVGRQCHLPINGSKIVLP